MSCQDIRQWHQNIWHFRHLLYVGKTSMNRSLIAITIFSATILCGCAGVVTSSLPDPIHLGQNDARKHLIPDVTNRAPDLKNDDGSETYIINDDYEWCGVTIWAVLPIPLKLPVCRNHAEATFKEGKIVSGVHQGGIITKGFWCSPVMPIVNFFGPNEPVGFCEKFKY